MMLMWGYYYVLLTDNDDYDDDDHDDYDDDFDDTGFGEYQCLPFDHLPSLSFGIASHILIQGTALIVNELDYEHCCCWK